ncbi:MAG: ERCC4 domain-containing protein [Nanoarchaeota archaeon]
MTFYNIFSKSPITQTSSLQKILIDNREKNSLVPSELSKLHHEIEFIQLKVGDYIVNNIPIERKTIQDLKSSIINKRIFEQLKQLQLNQGILIIEGIDENIYQGIIHENALRGFFLSLATENKVPFIFSQSPKDTAIYLSLLSKRNPNKEISLRQSQILPTKSEQLQFILEGFPNIGPSKAKALLKQFNSLKSIFNASESELEPILKSKTQDFLKLLE